MDEGSVQQLGEAAGAFFDDWYARAPSILLALGILIIGWPLARLARGAGKGLANQINRLLERSLRWGDLASARLPAGAIAVVGEILFWAVLLLAAALAARVAGVAVVVAWFDDAATYFPHLVIGALIIIIGWLIAAKLGPRGDGAESVSRRFVQVLIVAVATVIGLQKMGLNMSLPVVLLGIGLGATLLGFAVAFGLGAKDFIAANIASRALTPQLQRGVRLRVGSHEGELVEISATHLLIDAEDGHVLFPLSEALRQTIVICQHDDEGADDE